MEMKTPPIVTAEEWQAARQRLLVQEKELTRARDALAAQRRRMPWLPVEKDYEFDGPKGQVSLLDLFEGRRQLVIYRAFLAGCGRLARPRVPWLLDDGRPGRRPRPPERQGHHVRLRLARPAAGHRAAEGEDGLGLALVHHHQRLGRRPRRGRVPRHERVLPRRRPGVPHLFRRQPRRRGAGQHLELPRPGPARPPGDLGGLTRGLPADRAVRLVELARRVRPPRDGAGPDEGLVLTVPGRMLRSGYRTGE